MERAEPASAPWNVLDLEHAAMVLGAGKETIMTETTDMEAATLFVVPSECPACGAKVDSISPSRSAAGHWKTSPCDHVLRPDGEPVRPFS